MYSRNYDLKMQRVYNLLHKSILSLRLSTNLYVSEVLQFSEPTNIVMIFIFTLISLNNANLF